MRIVAGDLKGRTFVAPAGQDTRPTTDRVREAVFSTLYSELGGWEGVRTLDLYAGSGAFGFEALSRGALRAVGVDDGRAAARAIADNVTTLGLGDRYTLIRRDVTASIVMIAAAGPFDLVYLDPPYAVAPDDVERLLSALAVAGALADGAIVGYEHRRKTVPVWPAGFEQFRAKEYGYTAVSYAIYRGAQAGEERGDMSPTHGDALDTDHDEAYGDGE